MIHIQHPSNIFPTSLWLPGLFSWSFLFPGCLHLCFPQAPPAIGTLSLHRKFLAMCCLSTTLTLPILRPLPCMPTSTASCGQPTLDLLGLFCCRFHHRHCHMMWDSALITSALLLALSVTGPPWSLPFLPYLHTAARTSLFKATDQANWRRVRTALSHP